MALTLKANDFASLSIRDLLEARDLYHLHLMNKKNVVATAVGYYRIRKQEPWPSSKKRDTYYKNFKSRIRTLDNSEVRPYSWPAILVFVKKWELENELARTDPSDLVPKTLYLPNGKMIPVCVVAAEQVRDRTTSVDLGRLKFPRNVLSGGFPLFTRVQQEMKVASLGCLVTDGHLTYAMTNKHVCGTDGSPVYTLLDGKETEIGIASSRQLGRMKFQEVYPGFNGNNVYLNMDIGLIKIHDRTVWKTEIFNIGPLGELVDLHSNNLNLQLIGQKVTGYGCASQKIEGSIEALFYRYKSIGGFEYVSDFLINMNGNQASSKQVGYGDSGTILLVENKQKGDGEVERTTYSPIAILWGKHQLGNEAASQPYALATSLSTACNLLEVDIVRDWNTDIPNTWGKTGHFKIAAKACELVSDTKLKTLLMANQKNIGYEDDDLETGNVVSGAYSQAKDLFVPLADVADIIWRSKRKNDASNHFADMDESHPDVFGGRSLLDLCKSPSNVDIDKWNQFYSDFEDADPTKDKNKRGALPFRIWQMYNLMVDYISQKKVAEFIAVGGLMSHYAADACQPLHISHLHHGEDSSQEAVHSDYETKMIDRKMVELFVGVNAKAKKVKKSDLIGGNGHDAAVRMVKLMRKTVNTLSPEEVVQVWSQANGSSKYHDMWDELGQRTVSVFAEGARTLAVLWQSAWEAGNGKAIANTALKKIPQSKLMKLYNDKEFAPSYKLSDPKFKEVL